MRNAGRVLGALLCTAALAGSALALRVVPGGRVLALLFCSPGAAFTLWQQAGVVKKEKKVSRLLRIA